jgi:hypothetical protein
MQQLEIADRERKRFKVRSAWISFAGRIAAQLIGAIATVTLGVIVLGRGHAPSQPAEAAEPSAPTVLIATPVRTHGETVIVMVPVSRDGRVDTAMAAEVADSYERTKAAPIAGAPLRTSIGRRAPQSADRSADSRETLESRHE